MKQDCHNLQDLLGGLNEQDSSLALDQIGRLLALGTLASGAGHQIANPLTGVLNYSELIRDRVEKDSDVAKFAGCVIEEGQRIEETIRMMRELGRNVAVETRESVYLVPIFQKLERMVYNQFVNRDGIEVSMSAPEESKTFVSETDLMFVLALLLNAGRNALHSRSDSRSDKKSIHVSATETSGVVQVQVEVNDNGDGGSDSAVACLDRFIIHRMVKRLGSELLTECELEKRTLYRFDLP